MALTFLQVLTLYTSASFDYHQVKLLRLYLQGWVAPQFTRSQSTGLLRLW